MKSQVNLLAAMLNQFGTAVGYNPDKDILTIERRVEAEGNSFLDVTLPSLDDLLLEGLSNGSLPSHEGWRSRKGSVLPSFLYGFWRRIFALDGRILPNPCIHSIRSVRQISRTFKKVFEVCSDERVAEAVKGFVRTDMELSQLRIPSRMDAASSVAQFAFGKLIGDTITTAPVFRHGPGAVAERLDSVAKYDFPFVSEAIQSLVGVEQFRATWYDLLLDPPKTLEVPARLVAVPKTAVKPRLISIEPSYNQFIQQGYHSLLKERLSGIRICSYHSQLPNQKLALAGSRDGSLATIDLSEASDRVHMGVVRDLFRWSPRFVQILESTRSRSVQLPDGSELILNKFASMGSALTFPIEVMVFTVLVILAICEVERDFSRSFVRKQMRRRDVRVYGDDIIIPSKYFPTMVEILTEFGLKVNTNKSFSTGLFRESCGLDAYAGEDVTPVYARRRFFSTKRDVEELTSWSAFRNQFFHRYGEGPVTTFLDREIQRVIPYPVIPEGRDFGGLAREGAHCTDSRWSSDLQRLEVKAMVPAYRREPTTALDRSVLFKALYEGFNEDPDHLTHHGRPVSARLKYRWLPVL